MSISFTPELLVPSEQDLETFEALFRDTSAIAAGVVAMVEDSLVTLAPPYPALR